MTPRPGSRLRADPRFVLKQARELVEAWKGPGTGMPTDYYVNMLANELQRFDDANGSALGEDCAGMPALGDERPDSARGCSLPGCSLHPDESASCFDGWCFHCGRPQSQHKPAGPFGLRACPPRGRLPGVV